MILEGPRLLLRPLTEADAPEFAAMNGDATVMQHFVKPLDFAASEAFRARIAAHFAQHGFGFWGVSRHGQPGLVGMVGLLRVAFEAQFTPNVEIGWRIAAAHQRQGYAEEAARIALAAGFGPLRLPEIVAWTTPGNEPSWRLMEKLGMHLDGLFEEPRIPQGHPKRVQRLYRINRAEWVRSRMG